ncbi:MAG: TonB-dependent receptor plug domain-containing protein [Elusimicrobiota bacterium]
MRRTLSIAIALALVSANSVPARAASSDDDLKFFEEEAQVVSASLKPSSIGKAPATVYVVTSEYIRNSGAQTIWDALRTVPGVDVMETRADQGEVSIRGLNKTQNNRTLVLLDGKTVLNGLFDSLTWESIPVTMAEIDRIEVVEGPASALYGANAVSGVINIITKTPEQLKGGVVSYAGGTANSHSGTALYGNRAGKADYKFALGDTVTNGFENEGARSSQASKFDASAGYDFSKDSQLTVSGGLAKLNTQISAGSPGTAFDDENVGFLRTDYNFKQTKLRAFWNRGEGMLGQFAALGQPGYAYNTFDVNLQHSLTLPFGHDLVVGGSYRRNSTESNLLTAGPHSEDLWSMFFEDQWKPFDRWMLDVSGRFDRHPLTPLSFSPHGSAVFEPTDGQSFRLSAGTSFRNPTLLENYLQFAQVVPNPGAPPLTNPPFTTIREQSLGNRTLGPERMFEVELAHNARFGALQTTASVYYYRLENEIQDTNPTRVSAVPPTVDLQSGYTNHGGTKAIGFELGAKAQPRSWLDLFANYSYQSLKDDDPSTQTDARSAPRNKVNAGFTAKRRGLTTSLSTDWVDETYWTQNQTGTAPADGRVPDYFMLNGRIGYAFSGRGEGWEVALVGFNMLNRAHYEILPAVSPTLPGQNGEIVRSRWIATAAYRF